MSKKDGPESFLKQKCDTIFVKSAHSSVGKGAIRVHPSFTPDEHCVIRGKTLVCDFFFFTAWPISSILFSRDRPLAPESETALNAACAGFVSSTPGAVLLVRLNCQTTLWALDVLETIK